MGLPIGKHEAKDFMFHSHPDKWELMYYLKGPCILTLNGTPHTVSEGDIVFIAPGTCHGEWSQSGYSCYFMYCDVEERIQPDTVYRDNDNRDIYQLLTQMFRLYPIPHTDLLSSHLLEAVKQYAVLYTGKVTGNPEVEKLVERLNANISNPDFSLQQSLETLYLSPAHLRMLFKKEMQMSPLEYLNRARIRHAQELMMNFDPKQIYIKEISRMCGFSDPFYFSRLFKKFTGLSPSSWVEKQRTMEGTE